MQRRQFLGAAAALAALPEAVSAKASDPENIVEGRSVADDGAYTNTDCGSVDGDLNEVNVAADMNAGPIKVSGVHNEYGVNAVDLNWSSGPLRASTALDPDDARDLAARLVVAADAADGKLEDGGGL